MSFLFGHHTAANSQGALIKTPPIVQAPEIQFSDVGLSAVMVLTLALLIIIGKRRNE